MVAEKHCCCDMDAAAPGPASTAVPGGEIAAAAARAAASGDAANVPYSPVVIDIKLELSDLAPHVIDLCKFFFEDWSHLDLSSFSVERVSGGITNLLLKVSAEGASSFSAVTVRMYGPNTELVIDRDRELKAIPYLSAAGFGAELLAIFGNGVVQSFIDADTLEPSGMREPNMAAAIARELRRFHQVDIPGCKEPQLWNDIFKFFSKASILEFDDHVKQAKYEGIPFAEISQEINDLKDLSSLLNSPVVYAHNDLLSGNIMFNKSEEKLYFIDFEYGSYNYRGFDIANHFNEYAGFNCDYTMYPDKDAQYHFFRNYLQPDSPEEVPDHDLEVLYVETNTYRLASHICWALWSLIQASVSSIHFDYFGYFFLRYNEYKKQKDRCTSLAQNYLRL